MPIVACLALLIAATPDDVAEARKHFEAGRALYSVNRFSDAVVEFEAGRQLAPRPLFIFNIAQALRRLAETNGDRPTMLRAQASYRTYLEEANPQDPEREDSHKQLTAIDRWLAENPAVDVPVVTAEPAPLEVLQPPPEPAAPPPGFFGRNPWVIPVGGVLVIGAAVTGTYFGVRAANQGCSSATIGCLDAR